MNLLCRSVLEFGLKPSAELTTAAFADYIVTIALDEARLAQMARIDAIDFGCSRVVYWKDRPAGVALVGRRGWTSRLAAMALLPEARGQGVGKAFVELLLDESRQRGDRQMVLEVIEQNEPAVRLYDRCGCVRVRRLVGFQAVPLRSSETACPPKPGEGGRSPQSTCEPLQQVDLREVGAAITAHSLAENLPWQVSGETIAQLNPPARGYRIDGAWGAISTPDGPIVRIRGLAADADGAASEMLRRIRAAHAEHPCEIVAIWPEEAAKVFTNAGFTCTPLSQFQLCYDLTR